MGQLKQWREQNWVRIGTDGSIKGPCGTSKNKKNPDRCLPKAKAQSLSKSERAKTARKKKAAGAKGKTVVANTKKARVSVSRGGEMLKNKSKADLNKDGNISSYEMKRGMAIEKAMSQQNRVKKKNGGFIAKGCGKVMNNRRKVTTISQEIIMPAKKAADKKMDAKMKARQNAKVRPDEPVEETRIYLNMPKKKAAPKKKAPAKKKTTKK